MAVRVLLVVAFAFLFGCGQASSPVERQEKQEGVEQAKLKEPKEPTEQATMQCEDFVDREAAQEYLDVTGSESVDPDGNGKACDEGAYLFKEAAEAAETLDDYDSDCRFAEYALHASPKQSDKVFDRLADDIEMNVNASESELNRSKNATLDAMNVPRYSECKMGG